MLTFEKIPQAISELSFKIEEILRKLEIGNPIKPDPRIVDGDTLEGKLGITRQTLGRWRKNGRIPYIQVGQVIRYDLDKVIEALENKKRRQK